MSIKKEIDNFFDKVLVMDKNEDLKMNRLILLKEIVQLFSEIGDLSKIVVEG